MVDSPRSLRERIFALPASDRLHRIPIDAAARRDRAFVTREVSPDAFQLAEFPDGGPAVLEVYDSLVACTRRRAISNVFRPLVSA